MLENKKVVLDDSWESLNQQIINCLNEEQTGGDLLDYIQSNFEPKKKNQVNHIIIIGSGIDSVRMHEIALSYKNSKNLIVLDDTPTINEKSLKEFKKELLSKQIPIRIVSQVKEAKSTYNEILEKQKHQLKKNQKRSVKNYNKVIPKKKKR